MAQCSIYTRGWSKWVIFPTLPFKLGHCVPCVHIELSIGFYGNYKRFKKKIAKEKSKKSSPKNLVIVLVLVLQAFLDKGLPRGNRHERDS